MLDLVVDFTTYVFVPAYAIGVVPAGLAGRSCSGSLIVVTGALYFADRNMKTADNYFRGFPAVWNLVAFYLLLLQPEPWVCAVAIVVFAALQFVPVRFVHPLRVAVPAPGDGCVAWALGGARRHGALRRLAAGILGQSGALRDRALFPAVRAVAGAPAVIHSPPCSNCCSILMPGPRSSP